MEGMDKMKMTTLLKLFIVGLVLFAVVSLWNTPTKPTAAAVISPVVEVHTPPLPEPVPVTSPTPVKVTPKPKKYLTFEVTAYCPCKTCCGKKACGLTADGTRVYVVKNGKKIYFGKMLIAADWDIIKKHTTLNVPGYGTAMVRDTGKDIKGYRLDVYFDSHQTAKEWGRRKNVQVEVLD